MVSSEIHWLVVICHCNAAIHSASVMNRDNTALKAVQLIRNVLVVNFVPPENAEANVIQEIVWKDNCVKKAPVSLVAEIIWIAQAIDLVSMANVWIHVH